MLNQIALLEGDLRSVLHEQETHVLYQIKGKRIEFERTVKEAHRRLKRGLFRWLVADLPQNLLTAPIIYGMGIPLVLLDLCVTLFQAVCFPIYRIAKVRRSDYIVFDRRHLAYLNSIEKFHCTYCAYACEITARTEQYFCPIKHARKVLGSHSRYARFLAYWEAADYHGKLEQFRTALAEEKGGTPPQQHE